MDLNDIKILFEAHFAPIKEDIKELKEGQKVLIEIALIQAKQEKTIHYLQQEVEDIKNNNKNNNNRIWDVARIAIGSFIGAIIAKIF